MSNLVKISECVRKSFHNARSGRRDILCPPILSLLRPLSPFWVVSLGTRTLPSYSLPGLLRSRVVRRPWPGSDVTSRRSGPRVSSETEGLVVPLHFARVTCLRKGGKKVESNETQRQPSKELPYQKGSSTQFLRRFY